MGGSPSIPSPPPPPDPAAVAQANAEAYKKNIETYIEKAPEMASLENKLRIQYVPQQRSLERQYGPQRTLESLRRQYETSPQAYALNRGLGDQMTRQFERLYGTSPYGSVEPSVAFNRQPGPVDFYGTVGTNISNPELKA